MSGRCVSAVAFMSDEEPKCIAIDGETDHHIVHRGRFGTTYCATDKALDPGPHIDVLALNLRDSP